MPDVASDDLFLGERNEGVQSKTIQSAGQRFAKKANIKKGYSSHIVSQYRQVLDRCRSIPGKSGDTARTQQSEHNADLHDPWRTRSGRCSGYVGNVFVR